MKREGTWLRPWVIGLATLLAFAGIAWAAIPSARLASVRLTAASSAGTAGTAANPTLWSDSTTRPNLRLGDGTADQYVPTCTPTTNGDVCSWNGTNWVRAAGGGGGGGSVPTIGASVVDYCGIKGGSTGGANLSYGQKIWFTKASTITGIRAWHVGGLGAKTLALTLWSSAGSSLATVNVSVNAAGVYSGTFGSSYAVTSALTYTDFYVTAWINDGTAAYSYTGTAASFPSPLVSPYLIVEAVNAYASGNASPTTVAASQYFPVEPVFTSP